MIGDVIADAYRECTFKKECPDAPGVRAVIQNHGREVRPGGAANVAVNLAALSPDTQIDLIGVIDDDLGRTIKFTSHNRIGMEYCVFETPLIKERVIVDGQFAIRIDNVREVCRFTAARLDFALKCYLSSHTPDLIILSDYAGGSVNEECLERILAHRDRLLIDTKKTDLSVFSGSLLIKLNKSELHKALETESTPESFCRALVTTCGEDGAVLHMMGPHPRYQQTTITHTLTVKAHRVPVKDACGCGDTFLAGLAASLLTNDDPYTAMQFANAASASVVTQPRTAVADRKKTLELLGRETE